VGALTLEYFDGPDFGGTAVRRERRRRLELTWLGVAGPGVADGPFSVRARGTFRPAVSGDHTFSLVSAGASRLLLDGALVLDSTTAPTGGDAYYGLGSTRITAERHLTAGRDVRVDVEYHSPGHGTVMGVTAGCREPSPPDQLERAVALAAGADTVVLVVGTSPRWEAEGRDRADMDLPGRQDELVRRVVAANRRTVVVVNAAAPVSMGWADEAGAVLQAWFPGQEGGHAITDVLLGDAEPGGRLPITIPARVADCPADLTYPGEAGAVSYGEGVFVGYRGYERRGVTPRFCFGHGLSYTTFEYGPVTLAAATVAPGEAVVVRVAIRNTGRRRGSEVVQVYLRDLERSLLRPDKELKGFVKVELDPGETRRAEVVLPPRALAAWDPRVHDWVAEPGIFEVLVGASSTDLRGHARFELTDVPAAAGDPP
jgi:beta-glucosidase